MNVQVSASTVDPTDSANLTATVINDRNSAGVSWNLSGPGQLSNNSVTSATYTAPAPTNSALQVTVTATSVTDPTKSASVTIAVAANPAITTARLASGAVGQSYSQSLTASGGVPPYTWKLAQGALPSCITLNQSSAGTLLGGTPNAPCAGEFTGLVFQVTDSGAPNALSATTQPLELEVAAAPAIKFAGPWVISATPGVAVQGSALASGGVGNLTYSVAAALPSWLTYNQASNSFSGTPPSVGSYRFSFTASDPYGDSRTQPFEIGASNPVSSPIQHVVVIMQENRTIDNLFNGFPGADTVTSGVYQGTVVPLAPVLLEAPSELNNGHHAWWNAWDNGKMDGFSYSPTQQALGAYAYVPQSETQPYWTLASQYTLADEFFQSNTGPSFPAHQYMIAAQSGGTDGNPTSYLAGCDAPPGSTVSLTGPDGDSLLPGVYPCFNYTSAADLLDDNGLTWRYYAAPYDVPGRELPETAYEAVSQIFFSLDEETNNVTPQTKVLTDVGNGRLAQVTWVTPDSAHSDHPGTGSKEGPDWVASVVNAIGNSPFWDSTAIFINWDDWGGWYDHVVPVNIDYMGPGFRTPLIVVSPYAKHGYVFHEVSETASLVTFIERNFNLPDLKERDAGANDLFDCFDFTQSPSPYIKIKTKVTVDQLLQEKPTGPPDND